MTEHPFSLTPRRAVLVTLQLVALQFGCGILVGIFVAIFNLIRGIPTVGSPGPLFLAIGNIAAFAFLLRRECRIGRCSLAESGVWRVDPVVLLIPLILIVMGITVVGSEADNVLNAYLPKPYWIQELFQGLTDVGMHPFSTVFCLAVVAPITEELLFRGAILRGLLAKTTSFRAVMISAASFAAMHLNPWQMPVALAYGVFMGWIYIRTRSLTSALSPMP